MVRRLQLAVCLIALGGGVLLTGCHMRLPGHPTDADRWRAPADVTDFDQLYAQNCAGCHGVRGKNGAARSLNDALYQAFIPEDELRKVIAEGRAGTNMPAFSQHAGGSLTDQQISLLITGMRVSWSKPDEFKGLALPSYGTVARTNLAHADLEDAANGAGDPSLTGDVGRGAAAYQTYCARCHGAGGGGASAGSIVDANYLNLVSDQGLRTTVVVGRADLGKPDWRNDVPGRAMSPQEIDDVIAWIAAQRRPNGPAPVRNNQPAAPSAK